MPETANSVFENAGVQGGLVVHLGCGDGQLTCQLRLDQRLIVHGLDGDPEKIAKAREHIHNQDLYGPVSVRHWSKPYLPYADDMVNLLVTEDLEVPTLVCGVPNMCAGCNTPESEPVIPGGSWKLYEAAPPS